MLMTIMVPIHSVVPLGYLPGRGTFS